MPQEQPDRPFLWSEIHSIAKERIAKLDKTIRTEIGKQKATIPEHEGERCQFYLLLEEKANLWADRGRDAYDDCLKEIGRQDSLSARCSVYRNSLSYFLSGNLLRYLKMESGCTVTRRDPLSPPGRPALTYTTFEVPHDLDQKLSQIIDRVKSRIEKEFTRTGDDLWAELKIAIQETSPPFTEQARVNSPPSPITPAQNPIRPPVNLPPDLSEGNGAQADQSGMGQTTRRELIDRFINRVFEKTGEKISRPDFYRVAGYGDRTTFERWQSGKSESSTAKKKINAVLMLAPDEFLDKLEALKAPPHRK